MPSIGPIGGFLSPLLGVTIYLPVTNTNVNSTTSATLQDADAANLAVSFVTPASGRVLVRLSCLQGITNTNCNWGLREAAGIVVPITYVTGAAGISYVSRGLLVTGLTPGSAHSYKWAYAGDGAAGTAQLYYGGPAGQQWGPAVMEVWSA